MPRQKRKMSMWFDYPKDPDKGRVEISNLDDEDIAAITMASMTNRTVYDFDTGKPAREQKYYHIFDRQETVARSVTNWENFYDQDGEQMACTDKAKRSWACNNDFMVFVNTCRAVVEKAAVKAVEKKRKNSSTIPAGSLE